MLEFYPVLIVIDYFISRPRNEEIMESTGYNTRLRQMLGVYKYNILYLQNERN